MVAIIGGGDGGVLREVVNYPHSVKELTPLIDIDQSQRADDLCRERTPKVQTGLSKTSEQPSFRKMSLRVKWRTTKAWNTLGASRLSAQPYSGSIQSSSP